jgi:hypothetical protein
MSGLNEKPWTKPWNDMPWKREVNDLEAAILQEKMKLSGLRQRLRYDRDNGKLQNQGYWSSTKLRELQEKLDSMVTYVR